MCANYQPPTRADLEDYFGATLPAGVDLPEAYPGSRAPIIRRAGDATDTSARRRTADLALFGLVPHWADSALARRTYNARSETVASKPSFRDAYRHGRFCVIPAQVIYEPNYESGNAVRFAIAQADRSPMGIAGIWEHRSGTDGESLLSFSMLTINADEHPLMRRFHKPGDEKRMVVMLPPDRIDAWLDSGCQDAPAFFLPYPAEALTAQAAPKADRLGGKAPAKTREAAQQGFPGM
ncbi:SOS response-associated peptidase [Actimicrobium sp. CCC2.4]|uniref:SOS response-associated peptidase n=1 Tax=Actimicrobium sp. CCC2.4 TaxID=3048606 RepID=UPI002AC8F39B|nr:SOS response-associated peptidase [Actimicrobium sp. CCC2.4]MEB0134589.1 SOS response-associated peptidase [Actimicrobium sp. CCC2.4]WPX34031.1 SOS response-associated peptidase [Actimicrobium sp. CCC2.4]